MNWILWLRILQMILKLIAKGMSKTGAIECAATVFGVSASAIRRKMS